MTSTSRKNAPASIKLDALFDYSKIQPVRQPFIELEDDDDDDVQILLSSKPSTSGQPKTDSKVFDRYGNSGEGNEAARVVEDDDWLEAPIVSQPVVPAGHRVFPADPTLAKIRQQKQELENIWQASVKNIEEASRLEARVTESVSAEEPISEDRPNKRQKILLKLQGEGGESHGVKIHVDEKLDKLFTYYADKIGKRPITDYVFRFDGQQLNGSTCPKDFDLEDEDIVEVFVKGATRRR